MGDIRNRDDVIYLRVFKHNKTALDRFLNQLVLLYTRDKRYSKIFRLLEPLLRTRYSLNDIFFKKDTHYYIIFADGTIPFFSNRFIKKLVKEKQFTPIALLYNPYSSLGNIVQSKLIQFNGKILSFDDRDSEIYGFVCTHEIYSKIINPSGIVEKDLYYIGGAKNRLQYLLKLFEDAKNHSVNTDFNIAFVPNSEQEHQDEINYCQLLPYPETLVAMNKCNCILEIQQSGQSGATLRYYEAVCYNKKLLTNNKNIVKLPFYNPKLMHVFERPEEIDWDWVKARVPVDYHYDGRFSPMYMIDKITAFEDTVE